VETLKKEKDFKRVMSEGKKISDKYFKAIFAGNELGKTRIAIVTRKGLGKAVERNRVKRRIMEAVRANRPDASADIVIFPDITAKTADFVGMRQAACRILQRIGSVK